MAGIKFLVLTLLGLDVVQHGMARCHRAQVDACFIALHFKLRDAMPVPYIPLSDLDATCGPELTSLTNCFDGCRSDDTITDSFRHEAYEAILKYICDDKDAYTSLSDVIGASPRQSAWKTCFDRSGIATYIGTEDPDVVCPKIRTFITCGVDVVKENNITAKYIRDMAVTTLKVFVDHYDCDLDSAVGTTEFNRWLCILALLFFLVHRVIRVN